MRHLKLRFEWLLIVVFAMAQLANAATVARYYNVTQDAEALTTPANIGDDIEITVGLDAPSAGGLLNFSCDVECSEYGTVEYVGAPFPPCTPIGLVTASPPCGETFTFCNGFLGLPAPAGDYLRATLTVPACASTTCADGWIDVTYSGTLCGGTPADARLPWVSEPTTEFDFGDAPDPCYPTLLANNGARHTIDANIYLGSQIDAEPDGQPTGQADGDDANNIDDEDGVSFITAIIADETADVEVVASSDGVLDAWLDFSIDGDWDDPGEQIFTSFPLNPGSNILTFNVPSDANIGNTYARFRFSTAGGLEPNGPADDGEVEDYRVCVECFCMGDSDSDYDNDTNDMNYLMMHLFFNGDPSSGWAAPIEPGLECMDLDCNGVLDTTDMNNLMMHLFYHGGPGYMTCCYNGTNCSVW